MTASTQSGSSRRKNRRNQKRQKKASPVIAILIVILVLLLGAVAAIYFLYGDQIFGTQEFYDPAAVTGQYHENGYSDEIAKGSLYPLVNEEIRVNAANGSAAVGFENVEANPYDLQLVLLLDGKTIYTSGVIKPGQYIENAMLKTVPAVGNYSVTARFIAYEVDSRKPVGKADYPDTVSLIVE